MGCPLLVMVVSLQGAEPIVSNSCLLKEYHDCRLAMAGQIASPPK